DRRGARPAAILGSALGALGFYQWAGHLQQPLGNQWQWIILAGAGIGFVLTPVTTDAVNRAPPGSFGEVTGITQTVPYFAPPLPPPPPPPPPRRPPHHEPPRHPRTLPPPPPSPQAPRRQDHRPDHPRRRQRPATARGSRHRRLRRHPTRLRPGDAGRLPRHGR